MDVRMVALVNLEEIGRRMGRCTDPTYHPVGRWHLANEFAYALPQLRVAYRSINNGHDVVMMLGWVEKYIPSVERNVFSLLMMAVKGELSDSNWRVNEKTGKIEFVEAP